MISDESAAGLFDGEGCVSIHSRKRINRNKEYCLRVKVVNTNLKVL